MNKNFILSLLLLLLNASVFAQLTEHQIYPSHTDPSITGNNELHYVYINKDIPGRNTLLLFFPGTTGKPWDYRQFQQTAANLGYHAIGLCYENLKSVNFNACPRTLDTTCHRRARYENWFGEDVHEILDISYPNSIMNRLIKLLQYLKTNYPEENWDQYLLNDSTVYWNKVVTAGHSQGGGHAAFAAKLFEIRRAIMISWTDWLWPGRTADWITMPGASPDSVYYGFIHTEDSSVYKKIPVTWENFDMLQYGPIVNTDTLGAPYFGTHSLVTSVPIDTFPPQNNFHNAPIVDWVTPIDSVTGLPVLLPVWQYLLASVQQSDHNAQKISPDGAGYIDPEILSTVNKMAFQTGTRKIYLADLDPATGLFRSSTGRDILIDTGATPLVQSFNGPEFGTDEQGWSIFYTKEINSTPQIWRADVEGSTVNTITLTTDPYARLSVLATKNPGSDSIHLLFSKGPSRSEGVMGWIDENTPLAEIIVDSVDVGVRWIDNSNKFVYVKQTGLQAGQLCLYDTENKTENIITNDSDSKTYSYGWFSPEYDTLLVFAVLNDTIIGIYKDTGHTYWDRIITIEIPSASHYSYFGSPEPFVAGNTSFISFVSKEYASSTSYVNTEVWVVGIEPDRGSRFMLRCDNGVSGMKRTDPESYIGSDEVFIYYNKINKKGEFEIWRYPTGISTAPTDVTSQNNVLPERFRLFQNYPNPFNATTTIEFSLSRRSLVQLTIYNITGEKIKTLINHERLPGNYQVIFNARELPTGIYFCALKTNTLVRTIKMVYVK